MSTNRLSEQHRSLYASLGSGEHARMIHRRQLDLRSAFNDFNEWQKEKTRMITQRPLSSSILGPLPVIDQLDTKQGKAVLFFCGVGAHMGTALTAHNPSGFVEVPDEVAHLQNYNTTPGR